TATVAATGVDTTTIIEGAAAVDVGGPPQNPLIAGQVTDGVLGQLIVRNSGSQRTDLTINDSGGDTRNVILTADSLAGFTPLPILYGRANLSSLTVNAGPVGNSFVVEDTWILSNSSITLNTGRGADTVRIEQMSTDVNVNGQRGRDTVNVGRESDMSGIAATLTITNSGWWSDVNLDDRADSTSNSVGLQFLGSYTRIEGLSPTGVIVLRSRELALLDVKAG